MALEEIKLWAMDGAGDATSLETADQTKSERLLEDTLVKNPEMLMPGLTLVGRQTPTDGGPLDLLGIDEDGRLVVFELKRGTLSRDAVAQVIDYASSLQDMPDDDLAKYISDRSGAHGTTGIEDFDEWYDTKSGGQGFSALKPVRMVLVGLGVDERTTRMVQFLADRQVEISLLTFHWGSGILVSTLLARQVQVEAAVRTGGNYSVKGEVGQAQATRTAGQSRPGARQAVNGKPKIYGTPCWRMFRENFQSLLEIPGRRCQQLV